MTKPSVNCVDRRSQALLCELLAEDVEHDDGHCEHARSAKRAKTIDLCPHDR